MALSRIVNIVCTTSVLPGEVVSLVACDDGPFSVDRARPSWEFRAPPVDESEVLAAEGPLAFCVAGKAPTLGAVGTLAAVLADGPTAVRVHGWCRATKTASGLAYALDRPADRTAVAELVDRLRGGHDLPADFVATVAERATTLAQLVDGLAAAASDPATMAEVLTTFSVDARGPRLAARLDAAGHRDLARALVEAVDRGSRRDAVTLPEARRLPYPRRGLGAWFGRRT